MYFKILNNKIINEIINKIIIKDKYLFSDDFVK